MKGEVCYFLCVDIWSHFFSHLCGLCVLPSWDGFAEQKWQKRHLGFFCPILEQTLQEKHSSDTWLHSATFFVRQWEMGQSNFFYPCCTRLTLKLALCVLYVYVHSPIPKCSTRMCGWFICFTTIGPAGRERIDSQEILQMCKTKIKNVWFVLFDELYSHDAEKSNITVIDLSKLCRNQDKTWWCVDLVFLLFFFCLFF